MGLEFGLPALNARAVELCAGLAARVSSFQGGILEREDGERMAAVLDVSMYLAADDNRSQMAKVVTDITCVAWGDDWSRAAELCQWTVWLARSRLLGAAEMAAILGQQVETKAKWARGPGVGEVFVEFTAQLVSTVTGLGPQSVQSLGIVTRSEACVTGSSDYNADAEDLSLVGVVWTDTTPQPAPYVHELRYVGAEAGDVIDVLDADDAVVESLSPPSIPAGIIDTSSLPEGEYRARLGTVLTVATVQILGRP